MISRARIQAPVPRSGSHDCLHLVPPFFHLDCEEAIPPFQLCLIQTLVKPRLGLELFSSGSLSIRTEANLLWEHCFWGAGEAGSWGDRKPGSWLEQEKLGRVTVLARPFQTAPCPSGHHPRSTVQKLSIYAQPALACLMAVILAESLATHDILPTTES